ncbi:MAG: DUF5615 family PIN-like protein [Microbacteriaceae bacterium]
MTARLLLDEHYSDVIAVDLSARGYDVVSVVADAGLRSSSDADIFRWAADAGRRIVTENIKDFRPQLVAALAAGEPCAPLLLVPPRRFPRSKGVAALVSALATWLDRDSGARPIEDWLL